MLESQRSDVQEVDPGRAVRRWLWVLLALVFAMVIIGGITRLTGSGLSMVEWRPVTGALPPLTDGDWELELARYRESPQFRIVHPSMGIEAFKRIFFWEYLHRLVGRLVGVAFALPFLWFLARRRLGGRLAGLSGIAFLLGGAQGALGWYMVASGLVDVPAVSHYRLAAHLLLAFTTAQYLFWLGLELRPAAMAGERAVRERAASERAEREPASRSLRGAVAATLLVLIVQVVYGAFMAGTRAGHVASTFPDMNGSYAPWPFFTGRSITADLLTGLGAIHYVHRALAALLVALVIGSYSLARRSAVRSIRRAALFSVWAMLAQVALGAVTVLLHVPIEWAVAHQAGALVVLLGATWLAYEAGLLPRGVLSPVAVSRPARATSRGA